MRSVKYCLTGFILINTAILIIVFFEVFIALLAALIIMVGIGSLDIGHTIGKSKSEFGVPFSFAPLFFLITLPISYLMAIMSHKKRKCKKING
jgi:hypothetical protein